ncbi:MAG TPA: hypothetical protein VLV16_03570 [Gemmatimonadales bacterium]|nr:hypothetical protein [Gemmatimonadales bacterium]
MIRSTMLAVALLATPAFLIAAQPAYVARQAPQHDSTKAKTTTPAKSSTTAKKSTKSSKPAPKPAPKSEPKPAAAKDSAK